MAKAYGRRPSEWLGPTVADDDPLLAFEWDRVVFYAGTRWENEQQEKGRNGPRPMSAEEKHRIKQRDKMTTEQRKKAGHFDSYKGLAQPGIPKKEIPESGIW